MKYFIYAVCTGACPTSSGFGSKVLCIIRPVARGGSVGSEELPSQRKVHYLVMKGPLLKK